MLFNCYVVGATWNCCCVSVFFVHHVPHLVTLCKARHVEFVCLAVTCHLHFWQNDWDLLDAPAVARGWSRYQNNSQHRKLSMEKKTLPPLLQGSEQATFWSWVRHSNHWATPPTPIPVGHWTGLTTSNKEHQLSAQVLLCFTVFMATCMCVFACSASYSADL